MEIILNRRGIYLMYKKAVIPGVDLESSLFNNSCKPYFNLDSQFPMRCPEMTRKGFTMIE